MATVVCGSLPRSLLVVYYCLLYAANHTCESGYHKCSNSELCISVDYFCDGTNDCGDDSDENTELCGQLTVSLHYNAYIHIYSFIVNMTQNG